MSATQTQTDIPAGTWKADALHSHAGFAVTHNAVGTFRGSFADFDAELRGGEDPRLEGVVEVESVDVKDENLKGHLLSPEFFDADRHPEVRFSSTELREDGEGIAVEGELSIRGETKTVAARGTITEPGPDAQGGQRLGLDLETTLDRTEYGLNWNAELPSGELTLGNEVTIAVHLELVKEG